MLTRQLAIITTLFVSTIVVAVCRVTMPVHGAPESSADTGRLVRILRAASDHLYDSIIAGDSEAVRMSLNAGAPVNGRGEDVYQSTPLINAAGFGKPEIVRVLLSRGAAVNARTLEMSPGRTALWAAADADVKGRDVGYAEVIRLLISHGANPNISDDNGVTPLDVACYRGRTLEVAALLDGHANPNWRDAFGKTPLEWASYRGYQRVVNLLRTHGARIHAGRALPGVAQRKLDEALFDMASDYDNQVKRQYNTMMRQLLHRGADPNCVISRYRDIYGSEMNQLLTPLFETIHCLPATRLLVRAGANVNKRDDSRRTPLIAACYEGDPAVVEFLLRHGANANARDNTGQTALMCTRDEGDLEQLQAHRADINARDQDGRTALMMATDDHWGEGSAAACDASWVRVLLRHGAKVNLRDPEGNTALMLLVDQGEYGYFNRGNPIRLARLLLAHGADLSIRNKQGLTAVQIATRSGAKSLRRLLLHQVRPRR